MDLKLIDSTVCCENFKEPQWKKKKLQVAKVV